MQNDEISLKELIEILLKKWTWIVYPTVVVGLFSILLMYFLIPKTYVATNQIIYKIPESIGTKYGTYVFPSQSIQDYLTPLTSDSVLLEVKGSLNLEDSLDVLRTKVTVDYDPKTEQQFVSIKTASTSAEEAKRLNDKIIDVYISTLEKDYKNSALKQFIYEKTVSLDNLNFSLSTIQSAIVEKQALMDSISSIYTLQKGLFGDPKTAALYADKFNLDLSKMSDDVIIEEYLNENYTKLDTELINLKTSEINTKETIKFSGQLLDELNTIKSSGLHITENDNLNILYGSLIVTQEATLPSVAESRGILTNSVIASILVAMVMVFVVFFIEYWQSNV